MRIRFFLRRHWFAIAVVALVCLLAVPWYRYLWVAADEKSLQWTLAALIQSAAALLGILALGLVFAVEQSRMANERLHGLFSEYKEKLTTPVGGYPSIAKLSIEYMAETTPDNLGEVVDAHGRFALRGRTERTDVIRALVQLSWSVCADSPVDAATAVFEPMTLEAKRLNISDMVIDAMADGAVLKESPRRFFELVLDVFGLTGVLYASTLGSGWHSFVGGLTMNLFYHGVSDTLRRMRLTDISRARHLRLVLLLFTISVIGGLFTLSGTTDASSSDAVLRLMTLVAMGAFVTSVALLLITIERLTTDL